MFSKDLPLSISNDEFRRFVPGYSALCSATLAMMTNSIDRRASILINEGGSGVELIFFGESEPQWEFVAIEPREEMIQIATEETSRVGMHRRVTYQQTTFGEFSAKYPFSSAVSLWMMRSLKSNDDKLKYLEKLSTLLQPGAPMFLLDVFQPADVRTQLTLTNAWKTQISLGNEIPLREIDTFFREDVNHLSPLVETELLELLMTSGFKCAERYFQSLNFGGWKVTKA